MAELWTPVQVEQQLSILYAEIPRLWRDLGRMRDAEVDAKAEHDSARRRAMLGPDAPKVERGGATVADRDAWVDEQVKDLAKAAEVARVRRETAQDHLRYVLDRQVSIVQSINRSVDSAYQRAGAA
jgi:hypothetical protein